MPPASRHLRAALITTGLVLSVAATWSFLGYPTSFDEGLFLHKLSSSVSSKSKELKLAELMPGDWELVCESHSYDGPLYLKRYNKTFPPAAPSQDGVWGFIFIAKDGSYSSAVGSCGRIGVHLTFEPHLCIERSKAILSLTGNRESCATFSAHHG